MTVTVPHTFGNRSGIVAASELDDNFAALIAAIIAVGGVIPVQYATTEVPLAAGPWTIAGQLLTTTTGCVIADTGVPPAAFDIFWTTVPHGAAAPADGVIFGAPVDRAKDFSHLPVGDLYLRSPGGATATVMIGTTP